MKDIVTFETAVRLRDAGFPQPTPEFGQKWYNPDYGLFVVGFIDAPYAHATIFYDSVSCVFRKNIPNFSGCAFAPTATDILRELRDGSNIGIMGKRFLCYSPDFEHGIDHPGTPINDNPAEAVAEAWLKLNPKIKKDFIRQTDEE